jgi:N-terminal acetyltransferase B complex catalytic subunit
VSDTHARCGARSHNAYFVDLFVRVSNSVAYDMYSKFGYTVYRRVLGYYSGSNNEDAFGGCRRALAVHRLD